jgi:hypothetical protein
LEKLTPGELVNQMENLQKIMSMTNEVISGGKFEIQAKK